MVYRTMQPEYESAECMSVVSMRDIEGYLVDSGLDAMVCWYTGC